MIGRRNRGKHAKTLLVATLLVAAVASASVLAAGAAAAEPDVLKGREAFGDWRRDRPGTIRLISPQDLPRPGATASASRGARVVPRPAGASLQVPPGFKIERFAEGLSDPRLLKVAPNGDIFVAETGSGQIRVLRAADGAASPSVNEIFAGGLSEPFGIAFFPSGDNPQWIYVANTDSVVRFAYHAGDLKASGRPETAVRACRSADIRRATSSSPGTTGACWSRSARAAMSRRASARRRRACGVERQASARRGLEL